MTGDPTPESSASDNPTIAEPRSGGSLAAPVLGRPRSAPATIGPYRVFAPLGEGGMGTVYEAEQEHPRRRVALKVIRGGQFVDAQSVRLFEREVQTLARLLHPNIAAIYEAGHTETGEHFFAMELVHGSTLDRYVAARTAPLDAAEIRFRLRLFLTLCGAVSYAHQRGVIHLDLKPSNVIVPAPDESSARGRLPDLKVLDFGLARITESDVEGVSVLSEVGVIRGTLAYMSPEQVRGESDRVDVRSDVYSLGVILHEMLTGKRPYDVGGLSVAEAIRVISEQPPTPLRQAWSGPRAPDPDLQTIIGKALEKEPADRYASAAALAEDVERYLESRPILARAPSTIYQLKKFVRRRRTLVGGIVATLVALLAGIVAATTFGLREAAQRRLAEQARLDTQAVVDFQSGMLREIDPRRMGRLLAADLDERVAGADAARAASSRAAFRAEMERINTTDAALTLIDQTILAQAIATAATRFGDRPRIHAQLLSSIGDTYRQLGLFDRAEPPLRKAITLSGGDPAAQLSAMRILAGVYEAQGRTRESESLYVATLGRQRALLGPDDPEVLQTMDGLGVLHTDLERYASAESLYAILVPAMRRVHGAEAPATLSVLGNAAWALTSDGKYAQAESLGVLVLALRRKVLGNEDRETMNAANNLAVLYVQTGRPELAAPLYEEDVATSRRLLGDEHPDVLVSLTNLGRLYIRMKRFDLAEPLLNEAVVKTRRVMPPGFFGLGISLVAHAEALVGLDRRREAEPEALEAYGILHALRGDDDRGVLRTVQVLVDVYEGTGRSQQALKWKARLPRA